MTQELTISNYKDGEHHHIFFGIAIFVLFSGIFMLGFWLFKYNDQTNSSATNSKKKNEYELELMLPGILCGAIGLIAAFFIVYSNHE